MPKLKRTKRSKRHRRYRVGRFSLYDETFELKEKRSPILSSTVREKDLRYSAALNDEEACKRTLTELVGNPEKDYHYLEENSWKKALIPSAKNSLHQIHYEFDEWAKKQVRNGHALEEPKNWPTNLLEKRLKAEAILDVYRKEKWLVEKTLKAYKQRDQKEREEKILKFGPQATGIKPPPQNSRREWLVDGQGVSRNSKGIPFIDEPSSPYHKMPLVYYRQLSLEWKAQLREKAEQEWEEIEEGMRHKETGKVITRLAFSRLRKARRVKVSKDELPDWPDEAQKISDL